MCKKNIRYFTTIGTVKTERNQDPLDLIKFNEVRYMAGLNDEDRDTFFRLCLDEALNRDSEDYFIEARKKMEKILSKN